MKRYTLSVMRLLKAPNPDDGVYTEGGDRIGIDIEEVINVPLDSIRRIRISPEIGDNEQHPERLILVGLGLYVDVADVGQSSGSSVLLGYLTKFTEEPLLLMNNDLLDLKGKIFDPPEENADVVWRFKKYGES